MARRAKFVVTIGRCRCPECRLAPKGVDRLFHLVAVTLFCWCDRRRCCCLVLPLLLMAAMPLEAVRTRVCSIAMSGHTHAQLYCLHNMCVGCAHTAEVVQATLESGSAAGIDRSLASRIRQALMCNESIASLQSVLYAIWQRTSGCIEVAR